MISRFSQLFLALTTVTPLLLSIAVVLLLLYPSGYCCAWADLINLLVVPDSFYWWVANIFIMVFIVSWIWTYVFLGRLLEEKRCVKTITLFKLQPCNNSNMLPVVAMLPPWLTLVWKNDAKIVLTITIAMSLIVSYILSRQGYSSLIILLCGYKLYEGENSNGMKMKLLSRRVWRNHKDIREIAIISDNFALII